MAFTKAHRFRPADYYLSLICHVLSHPARIAILRKLLPGVKLTARQLGQGMPVSTAAVSQHLKILRDMQILRCAPEYPTVSYLINKDLRHAQMVILNLILTNEDHNAMQMKELTVICRDRAVEAAGL